MKTFADEKLRSRVDHQDAFLTVLLWKLQSRIVGIGRRVWFFHILVSVNCKGITLILLCYDLHGFQKHIYFFKYNFI